MSENPVKGRDSNGFCLDSAGVLRVEPWVDPLAEWSSWLEAGFGTRQSEGWPDHPIRARQVHSDRVVKVDGAWPGEPPEADALITNRPGLMLSVRTADCLPILIADGRNKAVAAIHAGWRGTVAGIAVKTVAALRGEYGSRPEDLWAAIGAGIGNCCFEVGPEVTEQFQQFFPERDMSGRIRIDLVEANRRQLAGAGIQPGHIRVFNGCTKCGADLFHSWRRDGSASGRMTAAIGIVGRAGSLQ